MAKLTHGEMMSGRPFCVPPLYWEVSTDDWPEGTYDDCPKDSGLVYAKPGWWQFVENCEDCEYQCECGFPPEGIFEKVQAPTEGGE